MLKTLIYILLLFVIVFLVNKNTKNFESVLPKKFDVKLSNGKSFAVNRRGDEN